MNRFDTHTDNLVQHMFQQKKTMDEAVFDTLSQIMDIAKASEDEALLGFAHFHLADSLYAFEVDYSQFRHHMSQAVSHLINTDEDALLARAYNYLGIDASNHGAFNIAYYHLMNALNTCEPLNDMYLLSIVNNNIGQVYARMNDNEKALEYVSLSNRQQVSVSNNDVYYYQNTINGYFSEGVLNIFLGNLERAKELEAEIVQLEKDFGNPDLTNVVIPVSFLRLMIAILDQDEKRIEEFRTKTMFMINSAHRLFDFITDVRDLCMFLIEHEHFDIVRTIIDAISKIILDSNVPRMKQHLYAIEISYYEKLGDLDTITRFLLDQHHTNLEQEREYYHIHEASMELIDTMNVLREQRNALEREAQTDSLTGIANRRRMEMIIDAAFESAFAHKSHFGIGILDINSFKEYNDFYGHQAGDQCLKTIAAEISQLAKEEGFSCARYGGDEFVLIYENKSSEEIMRIAQELDSRIAALNLTHEKAMKTDRVSMSQGICNDIPGIKIKAWDFLSMADKALYMVKDDYYTPGSDFSSVRIVSLNES